MKPCGDIAHLACDAWMLPTSGDFRFREILDVPLASAQWERARAALSRTRPPETSVDR